MKERVLAYRAQLGEKWAALEESMKVKAVVVAIGLITILVLTMYISFKPSWVVLKSNSDLETIGAMELLFLNNGIESNLINGATGIEVKEADVNRAKILVAESGITKDTLTFDDIASNISISMTENDKNEQYKRIKEIEMKQLIETFDNVIEASVMLALPDESVIWESTSKDASAGVTLTTTGSFTRDQGAIIANLIASSVEGIKPENVTIADTRGSILYSGTDNDEYSYSAKEEVEQKKYSEIESKIQATLNPLFDEVRIISNLQFDWDKVQERNYVVTPPVSDMTTGVPKYLVEEVESVVNESGAVEPGVAANDQMPVNYAVADTSTGTYDSSKTQTDFLYNEHEQLVEIQGGTTVLASSSLAVTVFRYKYYDEAILESQGILNDEMTWDQFKEENALSTLMELDEQLLQTVQIGTGITNVTITGYEKPIFTDKVVDPIAIEQIIVLVILLVLIALLALALLRKTKPDDIEEIEPEISIEDLIATNTNDDDEVEEDLGSIEEVKESYKVKLEAFIDENPEAAAQLLRNWINSDEWE